MNNGAEESIYLILLIKDAPWSFIKCSEENPWERGGIKVRESNVSFLDLVMSNKGRQSALLMVSVQYLLAFNLFELYLII